MADKITVRKKNDAWMVLDAEPALLYEVKGYFTFEVPDAKFHPKVKAKIWDGKMSLLSLPACTMYVGLLADLKEFCIARGYDLEIDPALIPSTQAGKVTPVQVFEFVKSLNVHSQGIPLETRSYQLTAIFHAINEGRLTLLSPTASGKSYILYCVMRWLLQFPEKKILIIVPDLGLVTQMYTDFIDYSSHNGFNVEKITQVIHQGQTKEITSKITVSTWQSIQNEDSAWLNQFDAIFCDEVHTAQAKSIRGIMERAYKVPFRIGATGTLSGSKTHELVIKGLFGRVIKVISTAELMERGYIAQLKIKCLVLKYQNKDECKMVLEGDYHTEIAHICRHEARMRLLTQVATSLKGNTLVLYNYVEAHGKAIYESIQAKVAGTNRKVFFIHGDVDIEAREDVRSIVEQEDDAIIIASYGTFSKGVNIRRLHNVVAASPTKSLIRVLQSIGRGLRKAFDKTHVNWIDIVDDFSRDKKKKNYAFDHFIERLKIYTDEQFNYEIVEIKV